MSDLSKESHHGLLAALTARFIIVPRKWTKRLLSTVMLEVCIQIHTKNIHKQRASFWIFGTVRSLKTHSQGDTHTQSFSCFLKTCCSFVKASWTLQETFYIIHFIPRKEALCLMRDLNDFNMVRWWTSSVHCVYCALHSCWHKAFITAESWQTSPRLDGILTLLQQTVTRESQSKRLPHSTYSSNQCFHLSLTINQIQVQISHKPPPPKKTNKHEN